MKPNTRLPAIPEQAAFMRLEYCVLALQPLLTRPEYLALRGKVARWDIESDEKGMAAAAAVKKRWVSSR